MQIATFGKLPEELIGIMRNFLIWSWILFPGCWALTGPEEVSSPLGGSLSVQCQYEAEYQTNRKYWCRGAVWLFCSKIIETEGSEEELVEDRVSIHDNHTQSTFTVTMEHMLWNDTDTYWCGIDVSSSLDPKFSVNVLVSSANSPFPATTAEKEPTVPAFTWAVTDTEKSTSSSSLNTTEEDADIPNLLFHILIPSIILVLLLILIVAVMCRRTSPKRSKALKDTPVKRQENAHTYNTNPEYTHSFIASDLEKNGQMAIYMNNPTLGNSDEQDSEYENMQLSQVSGDRKAASFGPEAHSAADQQDVYINMSPVKQSPPHYSQAKRRGKSCCPSSSWDI